ncbi:MAG: dihydrofolate reductase [Candidatus Magasanikbacteria bacterium]|nr:dihydrofolate reductase [Candidatus Magasanikbacteria bacterium]
MISIVCAVGEDCSIGKNNRLIWRISEDLQRFKNITWGHPILMGRKTFESIGHMLPGRENIIITRDMMFEAHGCMVAHSLEYALKVATRVEREEIFIIGGGEIFKQVLPFTDLLYLTIIHAREPDAEVFFPAYDDFQKVIFSEVHREGSLNFTYLTLERI